MSTTDKHTHIKPHETCVNIQDEMSLRTALVLGLSTLSQTTKAGTAKQSITAGSKKKDTHNGHRIQHWIFYLPLYLFDVHDDIRASFPCPAIFVYKHLHFKPDVSTLSKGYISGIVTCITQRQLINVILWAPGKSRS